MSAATLGVLDFRTRKPSEYQIFTENEPSKSLASNELNIIVPFCSPFENHIEFSGLSLKTDSFSEVGDLLTHPTTKKIACVGFNGAISGFSSAAAGFAFDSKSLNAQNGRPMTMMQALLQKGMGLSVITATVRNATGNMINYFVNRELEGFSGKNVVSGFISGIYDALVWTPISNIKQRVITGQSASTKAASRELQAVYGVRGLYMGTILPILLRNGIWNAAYCAIFGFLNRKDDPTLVSAAKGGVSSGLATCFSFPFERVRFENARSEIKRSLPETVKEIFKKQGLKGFCKGLPILLGRQVIVGSFLSFGVKAAIEPAQ